MTYTITCPHLRLLELRQLIQGCTMVAAARAISEEMDRLESLPCVCVGESGNESNIVLDTANAVK